MKEQMQNFARQTLKDGLAQLPESWQMMFKQMYSHGNLDANINDVVDNVPVDKLGWAMQLVENSLAKHV